jgi:hypothetical protein
VLGSALNTDDTKSNKILSQWGSGLGTKSRTSGRCDVRLNPKLGSLGKPKEEALTCTGKESCPFSVAIREYLRPDNL